MIGRRASLAAGALLLLGLSGCTGSDPEPRPSTLSPSPAVVVTSAEASPTASTLPEAAKVGTDAGAEAFIRYFWETYAYTYASGDAAPIQAISDSRCVYCHASAPSRTRGRSTRLLPGYGVGR